MLTVSEPNTDERQSRAKRTTLDDVPLSAILKAACNLCNFKNYSSAKNPRGDLKAWPWKSSFVFPLWVCCKILCLFLAFPIKLCRFYQYKRYTAQPTATIEVKLVWNVTISVSCYYEGVLKALLTTYTRNTLYNRTFRENFRHVHFVILASYIQRDFSLTKQP